MTGTILNTAAVIAGGVVGLLLGSRVPPRARDTVMDGIGLVVLLLGAQMALKTGDALIVLGAVLVGGLIGEALGIEERLGRFGDALRARTGSNNWPRFTEGFVAASILFCIGPMAIIGAIDDGLRGDYSVLAIKSILDGVSALAFASAMGAGVLFAAVPLFAYQGSITLLAGLTERLLSEGMVTEMTAAGGVIILGIGLRLLQIKQVRVANFLPALLLAPLLAAVT